MSKSIFNSDVFNSKNINNSNDLPDLNTTSFIADTATIGTLTNTELQAATSGVAANVTKLTGITYATSGDLTTIDNNVSVTGTITNTELQAATTALTGITYASSGDITTIANNLTIDTGKVLAIPNYTNVETTLTSLSNQQATNTSDITA